MDECIVVVVYQCFISNVMYTGDIEALFCFGSRCIRLLETHPLLGGTYPIMDECIRTYVRYPASLDIRYPAKVLTGYPVKSGATQNHYFT